MRRIGEIAARLVANPVELVAAANQKRSTRIEGGDGPMSQGEGEPLSPSPMLKQPGGAVASNENEKDGARSPASYTGVRVSSGRTNTPPTIGRDTTTAPHELPRSAVVVSLAMVRAQRHAALRSLEHRPDTTCAILEAPAAWRFDKTNSKSSPTF
jgi:hypothetical protein